MKKKAVVPRKVRTKIALLGFTQHRAEAPYHDDEWEIWGLNDLYLDTPESVSPDRLQWFQVHGWEEIAKHKQVGVLDHPLHFGGGPPHPRDANHVPWLVQHSKTIPIWMLKPRPEMPDAKILDREAMFKYFSLDGDKPNKYFTNSISWMLGKAIMDLAPDGQAVEGAEIGVYGVDMMMAGGEGSEYGYQRPSCEFFLGVAQGKGIKVRIPNASDLLKTAFQYGDDEDNVFREKLNSHLNELKNRLAGVQQQKAQMIAGENELRGANNVLEWILRSWMPGDGKLEHLTAHAPLPNTHKVKQ